MSAQQLEAMINDAIERARATAEYEYDELRAPCPLCGFGPTHRNGYLLPNGLRRHLLGQTYAGLPNAARACDATAPILEAMTIDELRGYEFQPGRQQGGRR